MAIEDFTTPLLKADVEVRLGTEETRASLAESGFDIIVCATGSRWDDSGFSPHRPDRDGMRGAERDDVITIDVALERALEDPRSLGERLVILDESAGYLPQALAVLAAEAGVDVEIVTPQLFVGEETQKTWEMNFLYPKLHLARCPDATPALHRSDRRRRRRRLQRVGRTPRAPAGRHRRAVADACFPGRALRRAARRRSARRAGIGDARRSPAGSRRSSTRARSSAARSRWRGSSRSAPS